MDPNTVDVVKTIATPAGVIIAGWLGAKLALRNATRTLQLQNEHRMRELEIEREAKDKKELQNWFEDYAIANCIDPLLSEILLLQALNVQAVIKRANGKLEISYPDPPLEACTRLFTLTGAVKFPVLLYTVRAMAMEGIGKDEAQKNNQCLNGIYIALVGIKRQLLEIDIEQKKDIYNVCLNPLVKSTGEYLDKCVEEMLPDTPHKGITPMTELLRKIAKKNEG